MATPTTSDETRAGLTVVTTAAVADTRTVAVAAQSPSQARAALFAATPLIIAEYTDGAAALALDWYEELRDAAAVAHAFTPVPLTVVREDDIAASVALATKPLYDLERGASDTTLAEAVDLSLAALAPSVQKDVARGFRRTIVGNAEKDPDAAGWARFTRAGACKFCQMLAGKGDVYTRATARFAAHTDCHCLAGPSFDPDAPKAGALQYVASSRNRTKKQRAELRDYLNQHYPDAPG